MLRGNPIPIQGLGSVRSPILAEIYQGIDSLMSYNMTCALLFSGKKKLKEMLMEMGVWEEYYSDMSDLAFDQSSKFSLIIHSPTIREVFINGLSLFLLETVEYWAEGPGFSVTTLDGQLVGLITEVNYNQAESIFKQTLGVNDGDNDASDVRFASQTAKEWWEKANELEESQPHSNSEDYQMPNIISKLSCANVGYTISSIYGLTVYQLYDQFYAYSQGRTAALGETAYAHNGGENFDHLTWLHKRKNN